MRTSNRMSTSCNASQIIISSAFLISVVVCCPLVLYPCVLIQRYHKNPVKDEQPVSDKLIMMISDLAGVHTSFAPARVTRLNSGVWAGSQRLEPVVQTSHARCTKRPLIVYIYFWLAAYRSSWVLPELWVWRSTSHLRWQLEWQAMWDSVLEELGS